MALKSCRECAHQVSTEAPTCPHCGATDPAGTKAEARRTVQIAVGLLLFLAVIVAIAIGNSGQSSASASSSRLPETARSPNVDSIIAANPIDSLSKMDPALVAAAYSLIATTYDTSAAVHQWRDAARLVAAKQQEKERAAAEKYRLAAKWTYAIDTDPMTSRTTRHATIDSENTVDFDFPYSGPQHGRLMLRDHPSYGRDAILTIERGQFLCSSYDGCSVRVRFDDGAPERFSASEPSDNSSNVLFIRNYARFVERLSRSKTVRIQPEVYQEGAPVFEFHVSGFDQARYRPTSSGGGTGRASGRAQGSTSSPQWVADPINKTAFRVSCGNGKYLIRRSQEKRFDVRYFQSESSVKAAGFFPQACADAPS